jgi:hypothetical protein
VFFELPNHSSEHAREAAEEIKAEQAQMDEIALMRSHRR